MQVKKIFQKSKKININENIINNNKQKKQKINNESIDLQKNYILSPTINNGNKQCYFYKPLKKDLSCITKKQIDAKFVSNKISSNNKINDKGTLKKDKIKVRLNSIKRSKDKNFNPIKSNKKLKNEEKIIIPIDTSNKTLIFNYSFIDIKKNNNTTNNKNNSNIFNSIQKTFESRTNKFQKFKNPSYNNFFYNLNSRSFKSLSNLKDLMNLNRNENNKKNNLNSNKNYSKTKFKQSINRIAFNKINNKKIIDINDISPTSSERYMNKSCLTRKKNNNITNSISLKTLTKDKNVTNLKMCNYNRNNDTIENSIFSPKYNYIQNTYHKKLVKRNMMKIDNNYFDSTTLRKNIKKPNNNFKEIDKKYYYENTNYNSPKNLPTLNNSESNSLLNSKKKNDNENNLKNNTISSNIIKAKLYNKNLYNKNLYNKNYFYNKEKDETKYQTEQNFISDNNCSTSISFYQNQKNKSSSINNKLISAIRLERKLKNIITSIDFKNTCDNFRTNRNNKNVILYEFDQDGKVNCKVREMKNSVEKIVRGKTKSKEKKKNKYIEASPPKNQAEANFSLYIKKNQGTVLRKSKNKKIIEFYQPCSKNLI